jgi:hypothetical protein
MPASENRRAVRDEISRVGGRPIEEGDARLVDQVRTQPQTLLKLCAQQCGNALGDQDRRFKRGASAAASASATGASPAPATAMRSLSAQPGRSGAITQYDGPSSLASGSASAPLPGRSWRNRMGVPEAVPKRRSQTASNCRGWGGACGAASLPSEPPPVAPAHHAIRCQRERVSGTAPRRGHGVATAVAAHHCSGVVSAHRDRCASCVIEAR